MSKYFLVSVANALGRDSATGAGLFYGTTNASTAIKLSMTDDEIRGGINNVIQGVYMHDKTLECTIEKPTFSKAFLPLNVGSNIAANQNVKVVQTECVVLDASGNGVISLAPVGSVNVFSDEDTVQAVTASSAGATYSISVPTMAGKKVTAIYEANEAVDVLTIETTTPPKVIDLTLFIQLRDENMNLAYTLQYNIPKFQVSGNYELSLSADGTSNESLEGKALNVASEDCTTGDMYATIKWLPAGTNTAVVSGIIITNGDINAAASTAATYQLTVIGLYGSIDDRVIVTDNCTFAMSETITGVTLADGTITIASSATAGSAYITASYTNSASVVVTDSIKLTIA